MKHTHLIPLVVDNGLLSITNALPEYYFEIGSVYGIITSIVTPVTNGKTSIRLSGLSYRIELDAKQEAELVKHYMKTRLHMLLKKKVSVKNNKIVSATLETYELPGTKSFAENIEDLRNNIPDDVMDELVKIYYTDDIL